MRGNYLMIDYLKRLPLRRLNCQISAAGPPWSVVFFGSDNFALSSLQMLHQELISGQYVKNLAVVCAFMKCPVAQYSVKNNFKIIPWKPKIEDIQQEKADVGFVVSFGHLIPQSIIAAFPLGMVNVHASLLPKLRGAAPIIHSVLNNDAETGVTLMKIRPHRFDCGEIISTAKTAIGAQEDAASLTDRLSKLGSQELKSCLSDLQNSLNQARPQPDIGVTYAPKVEADTSVCLWDKLSATQLHRIHLGLGHVHPLHASWQDQPVKFLDCSPMMDKTSDSAPGMIDFSKRLKQLEVTCEGRSVLAIRQMKIVNRKPLTAMDFVNGFLKRVPKEFWKFGSG